jgi:hypothetical protein
VPSESQRFAAAFRLVLQGALLVTGLIAMFVWAGSVARITYDAANPDAWALIEAQGAYTTDLLTRLPRNVELVPLTLVVLLSCVGPGGLALTPLRIAWRDEIERFAFALAIGIIALTFTTLAIGFGGLLNRNALLVVIGINAVLTISYVRGVLQRRRAELPAQRVGGSRWRQGLGVLIGLGIAFQLYIGLLGALGPEVQFDARWYHLGPARVYAERGAFFNFVAETHMGVAALTPYQTVLYSIMFALMDVMQAAKLVHWAQALFLTLLIVYFGKAHFNSLLSGLLAALIFTSTPLLGWSSATANTDLPVPLYSLLALHGFLRWRDHLQERNWLIMVGFLSGFSVGVKIFGVFTIAVLLIGVAWTWLVVARWRVQVLRDILPVVAASIVLLSVAVLFGAAPWLAWTYYLTGNPIFPFLNSIFQSPYWNEYSEAVVREAFQGYEADRSVLGFLRFPWVALERNDVFRAILGPLYVFILPVLLCYAVVMRDGHTRIFRLLLTVVTLWSVLWFASGAVDTRYTILALVVLVILSGVMLTAWELRGRIGRVLQLSLLVIVCGSVVLNNQLLIPLQRNATRMASFGQVQIFWEYLYRGQPEEQVQLIHLPMVRYVNEHLTPERHRVYDGSFQIIFLTYIDVPMYNGSIYDSPTTQRRWSIYDPDALERLRQAGVTHLTVLEQDLARLQQAPIWAYLHEEYQSPDLQRLYRIEYPL